MDIGIFIPRCAETREKKDLDGYGALVLSLVGDGVHTLFLRCALSNVARYRNEDLHKLVSNYARAEAQADCQKKLLPHLTDEEKRIANRGKNANFHTIPKHATKYIYSLSTAFEALTGYLYLAGSHDRLCELYRILYEDSFSEIESLESQNYIFKKDQEDKK